MRNNKFIVFGIVILVSFSCNNTPKELGVAKYKEWIFSEKNGLFKSKRINGVDIRARFVPAEYLAYNEHLANSGESYDSIFKSYQCGLTFQVDLEADKQHAVYGNLMYYGIASQEEFSERTRFLNFNASSFITVSSGNQVYEPVLSTFEGYNTLANKLSFTVVFVIPEYKCGEFTPELSAVQLTFKDPYWDLGVNHFEFDKKSITNIPKLTY